jgi:hypothetical protein
MDQGVMSRIILVDFVTLDSQNATNETNEMKDFIAICPGLLPF